MSHIQHIFQIADELTDQGLKPTVATIKSKLTNPMPLPTIIQALKQWQYTPPENRQKPFSIEPDDEQQSSEDFLALENRVQTLEQQVKALQLQVQNLLKAK